MLPPFFMPSGKANPVGISPLADFFTNADSSSYGVTNAQLGSLGADDPTREILAVVAWESTAGATLSSIGLINPTASSTNLVFSTQAGPSSDSLYMAIAVLSFPTGSTLGHDLVYTFSALCTNFRAQHYRVVNRTITNSDQYDMKAFVGTGTTASVPGLIVPQNGAAIVSTITKGSRTITFNSADITVNNKTTQTVDVISANSCSTNTITSGKICQIDSTWTTSCNWLSAGWSIS